MKRTMLGAAFAALALSSFASAAAVLLDRTDIATDLGQAADGANLSRVQFEDGVSVTGFAANAASGTRLADDFTVPASGWIIDAIEFVGFQADSIRSAPTVATANFRIWNGVPGQPGSTIVFGDDVTNRVTTSTFANVYRTAGKSADVSRPVFLVRASGFALTLPAGTYWLDYQLAGSLPSGPFTPPALFPAAGGDAMQLRAGSWGTLTDGGQAVALPFRLSGTVVGGGGAALDDVFKNGFE